MKTLKILLESFPRVIAIFSAIIANLHLILTAIVALWLVFELRGCFGLSKKALEEKVNNQEQTIANIVSVNKENADRIKEHDDAVALDKNIVSINQDNITKLVNNSNRSEANLNKQLKDIKDKFNALPQTPENTALKSKDISTVQLDSLWRSYCLAKPGETACL
jgi:vacuolar-type H+-ATPase subunit I/STV1